MKAQMLIVAVALFLGGCFTSEYDLYSADGGVKMPFEAGVYRCTVIDIAEHDDDITVTEKDGTYVYQHRTSGTGMTTLLAFHRVSETRYIVVITLSGEEANAQHTYGFAEVRDRTLQLLDFHPGRVQAVGEETGVRIFRSASEDPEQRLGGTPEQQRAFLSALALERGTPVFACTSKK